METIGNIYAIRFKNSVLNGWSLFFFLKVRYLAHFWECSFFYTQKLPCKGSFIFLLDTSPIPRQLWLLQFYFLFFPAKYHPYSAQENMVIMLHVNTTVSIIFEMYIYRLYKIYLWLQVRPGTHLCWPGRRRLKRCPGGSSFCWGAASP